MRRTIGRERPEPSILVAVRHDLNVIEREVEVMEQEVEVMEQEVEVMEQEVEVMEQEVEVMEQEVEVMEQEVEVMEQEVIERKESLDLLTQKSLRMIRSIIDYLKSSNRRRWSWQRH